MKKMTSLFITIFFVLNTFSLTASAYDMKMYAPDGRTITIESSEASKWKAVGWSYGYEGTTVFNTAGQSKRIAFKDFESYLNNGWYTDPVTTMYAPDGRTVVVYKSDKKKWEAVGWIDGSKTVKIYAPNNKKAYIFYKDLKSYLDLGWYEFPVSTVYSPNGLQKVIATADVPAWEAVGWSTKPDLYAYNKIMAMKNQYPEGMPWTNDNYYAWDAGIFSGGYGCAGFAFILSDAAFKGLPARMLDEKITIDSLRVGDILRINYDTHSVVVLEIHSDYIVVAEGNFNSSIHWGRKLYKSTVENATYVIRRY